MADTTERLLRLLATLQTGRSFTGEELASRLEASPRTLRRDIERLRDYGYPVHTQPGPGGFYQLKAGRTMPPLALDDDEAVAALLGVATLAASTSGEGGGLDQAASRAYGKLDQFLPPRLRPRVSALRAALETSEFTSPPVDTHLMANIAEAITATEVVAFDYCDAKGKRSRRRVEPFRHVYLNLRWYVVAWDVRREDWRSFRLDRMENLLRTGHQFAMRDLPSRSALEFLREGLHLGKERVRLTVDASVADAADVFQFQDVELEALTEQRTQVTMWTDSWQWLILNLAFLDTDFRIEEPAEFRSHCAAFATRLRSGAVLLDGVARERLACAFFLMLVKPQSLAPLDVPQIASFAAELVKFWHFCGLWFPR